ncbi:MAG: succinylglutamate desuccinylase, partial [Halobacteriales archaeon]
DDEGTTNDVPEDDEGTTNGVPAYEVHAENFERVAAGERFAAVDGDALVAERPFYPVLLSADGYADIFGYMARRAGTLP